MRRIVHMLAALLILSEDSGGQVVPPQQLSFLGENAKPVCTDEKVLNTQWDYIIKYVKDKKIILIGEPNHGSKEIFLLRNDLVQFLHEKLGFNAILFESGIGELSVADLNREELSAAQMTYGFFSGWRTKEFRDLMEYVKSENIHISGFDSQRTGNSFSQLLTGIAKRKNMDTDFYNTIEERYGQTQRELSNTKAIYDSVQPKTVQLIADYRRIHALLMENNAAGYSAALAFSLRTIMNRIDYLQYMLRFIKDHNWNNRWAARDAAMADNIKWLADTVYKNEKLIIVAHNYHVARYNENEQVMGEMLVPWFDKEMYAIGIFAGAGVYADNAGKEKKIVAPDSANLDIKHIISSLPAFASYLTIPKKKDKGSGWLYEDITVNDTFIDLKGSDKMILAKHFDGLLLVKKISLPDK
ncbi:MAG: erythromycin esterase family protein [Bacteroidota bacterium]